MSFSESGSYIKKVLKKQDTALCLCSMFIPEICCWNDWGQ